MENDNINNIDNVEQGNQNDALKNVEIVMMHTNNISSEMEKNLKKEQIQSGMQPLDLLCITNNEVQKKKKEKEDKKRIKRTVSTTDQIAQDILDNLSCNCKNFGCSGFLLLTTMLVISGFQFYIYFKYANPRGTTNFSRANMEFIWIFLIFSIIFFFQFSYFSLCWKRIVRRWGKKKFLHRNSRGGRLKYIFNLYNSNLGINGKFYLYKLYLHEFVENWIQFTNLITVYSCTLPIEWNALFALMLIIESIYRCKIMYKKSSNTGKTKIDVGERNFQVKLDIAIDLFFVFVPLFLIQVVYDMQISVAEIIQIIMMPSFSLAGKLRAILKHSLFDLISLNISKKQEEESKKKNRRRQSLYATSLRDEIAKTQNKYFPRCAKMTVFTMSFIYVLGLVVIVIGQLATISFLNTCDEETFEIKDLIWNKGCQIKIPFCNRPFHPKCNCAFLKIEGEKNLTKLPDNIVSEMDGLRKVVITNCSLKTLPPKMERLNEMVDFRVSYNKLNAFDVNISKWEKLVTLHLRNNNITRYDEKALWTHKNLVGVQLESNIGLYPPKIDINMPLLQFLAFANNGMTLNIIFNREKFPNLMFLYLNGNKLLTFPDESLQGNLVQMGVARCNLKSLPLYLSNFKRLNYLDARDNNITDVDDGLKKLIKTNNVESYFSGNEVCSIDKSLDCEPLCSKYCWSRHVKNDGYCDVECNSYECEYDGGDCRS